MKILLNKQITSMSKVMVRLLKEDEEGPTFVIVHIITNGEYEDIYENDSIYEDAEDAEGILLLDRLTDLVEAILHSKPNKKIFKETFLEEMKYWDYFGDSK